MDKTKIILYLISVRDDICLNVPSKCVASRKKILQGIENIIVEVLKEDKVILEGDPDETVIT